jgi:hypothetical protein
VAALTRTPLSGLPAAARVLDWPGEVLPDVVLLGTRTSMVIELDPAAHAGRAAAGLGPVTDLDTLAIWEWPEAAGHCPPSPVRLAGVLVPATRSWGRAVAVARRWRGFGPAAVLLPPAADPAGCRLECGYAGVGVIGLGAADGDPPRILQPGRPGRSERARRRPLDRWVEEKIYRRLLDSGALSG